MAFPQVAATATSFESTATNSHTVSLPTGVVSGDLLVVAFAVRFDRSISFPAGWTLVFDQVGNNTSQRHAVYYRQADGTEGSTVTVSTGGVAEMSAHLAYRVTGHENQAPEVGTPAAGSSNTPDPSVTTPTGGAQDYLWLAVASIAQVEEAWVTGYPTNYSNGFAEGAASGDSNSVCVASARRELNASSEDPDTFTGTDTRQWTAATVVIHPAADEAKLVGRSVHYDFANRQVVVESGV